MKTCRTCIHWVEAEHARAGDHECDNREKIHEEEELGSTDHLAYSYYEGGSFFPGPDFGCVHHKEREPSDCGRNDGDLRCPIGSDEAIESLERADAVLSELEDTTHGALGDAITRGRAALQAIVKLLSVGKAGSNF